MYKIVIFPKLIKTCQLSYHLTAARLPLQPSEYLPLEDNVYVSCVEKPMLHMVGWDELPAEFRKRLCDNTRLQKILGNNLDFFGNPSSCKYV